MRRGGFGSALRITFFYTFRPYFPYDITSVTPLVNFGLSPTNRRYLLLGVTVLWAINSYVVGKIAEGERSSAATVLN